MGDILGGLIGGVGSLVGAKQQSKDLRYGADKAAETARLGFDWAKSDPNFQGYATRGGQAGNAIGDLLGIGGDPAASEAAFGRYKDSTGYKFRLGEGMGAVTGSAAAKGLLNSGSTLKRLTGYGQDLASSEFGNYLGQLSDLSNKGLAAGQTIASAGSSAGASGAGAISSGYGNAANASAGGFNNALANFGFAGNAAWDKWGK